MALRFNPPPNWPAPPDGFTPPAGWQPDPAWGPAPEGWQLWVDDAVTSGASAASAGSAGTGADPAWAPTQAVPTGGSPVADPTGASASAPSGDLHGGLPVAASGPGVPMGASGPVAGSAPGASPYAPNLDYAQAPTPYQSQGQPGGPTPGPGGWQPIDVGAGAGSGGQGGSKPVTKQWWFWTIIGVVVLALVGGLVLALNSGGEKSDPKPNPVSTKATSDPSSGSGDPTASATSSGSDGGTSMDHPADPATQTLIIRAGKYDSDPDAYIEVSFGEVNWDATSDVQTHAKYSYQDPGADKTYVRVPVTIVYHGKDKMSAYNLKIDYVKDGSTISPESIYTDARDEFSDQDMPRDGGTATGYFTYVIPTADAHTGVWAVSAFYSSGGEMYMQAK